MNNYLSKTVVLIFITISIWLNTSVANDDECKSQYQSCIKSNFDDSWSLWDDWNAGQLNLSHDEFDTKHIDIQFKLLACDEVVHSCKSNREPNFKKYIKNQQSFPEADWLVSKPEKEGLDKNKLLEAISTAAAITNFRSILVAKNGKLVAEEYYSRKDDPRPQHIQSITKSITSLLIGIAIDKGVIKSEKEVIKPYFTEYFSKPHDERKQKITIEQLLTMSSRLNFADNPTYSTYEDTKSWHDPGSWKAYWYADNYLNRALFIDLVETDDEVAAIYNTPACNLLTTVLKRSANMTSKKFADKHLFGPLGIKNYFWFHDSNFNYVGGHTIFFRPRDLARIGQMILDGGSYQGRQIVSKEWLEKSFQPTVSEFAKTDEGEHAFDYGYLWWLGEYQGYKYQFGWGFGGQFLFLIPEANTLVVTTAYPDPSGLTHWERSQNIIKEVMHNIIEALPKITHS